MGSDIILCMALIASFIKKAEAEKNASVGYNNAQKEVAISESELQVIKAQSEKKAGEQVKAFEHINLGNITVFDGGQNSTGNFLNNVVKTVAPALGVIDQLPIADTLKKLKGDDKK